MLLSLFHRSRKEQKRPRLGQKCIAFWVPEARKRSLYDRAKQEKKTIQALLNELVRDYLKGRAE
jgi:hypothetical protein